MTQDPLLRLAELRKSLRTFLDPAILKELANFIQSTGGDNSLIERYHWFCNNSEDKQDCRYAVMAKEFFLQDHAEQTARTINWLYHNWSKFYEETNRKA